MVWAGLSAPKPLRGDGTAQAATMSVKAKKHGPTVLRLINAQTIIHVEAFLFYDRMQCEDIFNDNWRQKL